MTHSRTVAEVLQEAVTRLSASDSPRLDAEILLSSVLETDRARLYSGDRESVDNRSRLEFDTLVGQRAQGRPIAYLVGHTEFWSLDITVDNHVLVPRPETELVVETALERIPEQAVLTVADIGTGSGAIAVALATERPTCRILATDICASALAIAAHNIKRHGCDNITLTRSDWFTALEPDSFHLIVSNPPYVAVDDPALAHAELRFEPERALAAGSDGLTALRKVVTGAPRYLKKGGLLILEHGCDHGETVRRLMREAGFSGAGSRRDLAGLERVTSARFP